MSQIKGPTSVLPPSWRVEQFGWAIEVVRDLLDPMGMDARKIEVHRFLGPTIVIAIVEEEH